MKRILFICSEGFDTPGPSNHLIKTLIEDLLHEGFYVTLIQSRRQKKSNADSELIQNKEKYETFIINRRKVNKNLFFIRYVEEALYHFKVFLKWRKLRNFDSVFVQSCPTVIFSIILLKIFTKYPILYSIQDMWPGSAVNSGVIKFKFISKSFYLLQKMAYKYSDIITVISEDMKIKLMQQGVEESKIYIIHNWFDDKSVHEVTWDSNKFVEKYSLNQNKFYIQYAGTMGHVFDYKMVISLAERLKNNPDIVFHMIGQGSQKMIFQKEVIERKLDNLIFYPLESQNMVSDVYSSCSISLIPLKKGIIGNSVPSKAALLMACKRTIVASVDNDSKFYEIYNSNNIGVAVSNDNPDEVYDAIMNLYTDSHTREKIALNGYLYGKKHYSRSINTKKFIDIFYSI